MISTKTSTLDAAEKWLADHKDQLSDTPEEIRLRRSGRDVEGLPPVDVNPPATRPNKADAPSDFDPELGLITYEPDPAPDTDEVWRSEWRRMATDIIQQLGSSSDFGPWLPVTRPPELDPLPHIAPALRDALPELEALHRKLCPGWRRIVRGWLDTCAEIRVEERYRRAWERDASSGIRANLLPPRSARKGAELLELLRSHPRELVGEIPDGLTPEILEYLGGVVTRTGRGAGGLTPDAAMERIEEWITSPDHFRSMLEDARRKDRRRRRRRKK